MPRPLPKYREDTYDPLPDFPQGLPHSRGQHHYVLTGVSPNEPESGMWMHEDALKDRRELYDLSSDQEALEHIIWEHWMYHRPDSPDEDLPPKVRANFQRAWGVRAKPARGLPMTDEEIRAAGEAHDRARLRGRLHGNGRPLTPAQIARARAMLGEE